MNELARKTLCDIVANYGTAVYEDTRRFEGLLLDLCPTHRKEIRVLVGALNEKVPHTLLSSSPNMAIELLLPQMIQRLVNNLAINEEASEWSVYSWALALNIISVSEIANLSATQSKYSAPIVKTIVQPTSKNVPIPSESLSKKSVASKTHSRTNEIIAVVLLALAVLIFLCLVTFNPNDWSLNSTDSPKTQNWIGVVGSVIADLLLQIIGLTAYFLPILLGLMAWRFFRSEKLTVSFGRVIGYIFFVLSVSSLASLFDLRGGILGVFFAQNFSWLLGKIGAGIFLFAILSAAILLITNLSFAWLFDNVSMAWENFTVHFNEWFAKYRLRRAEKNKFAAEEAARRASVKAEKAEKAEKPLKTATTVSLGEVLTANLKDKKDSVEGKVSSVLNGFGKNAETAKIEPIPITAIQQETKDLNAEILEKPETIEKHSLQAKLPQNFDNYVLPVSDFLTAPPPRIEQKEDKLLAIARELTDKTKEFNVTGRIMHICQGPVVTTYEFKLDPGVKSSRLTILTEDLGMSVNAPFLSIQKIPEKNLYGIIIPNDISETIYLREVIESKKFRESKSLLTIALGKTIDGLNYVTDLSKMPNLFIVGEINSGKSILLHTIINSILYKARPDEVKFILVDPKRLELGLYADIPHLATPIITDPERAAITLKWAISEMEKRYKDLAGWGVRNIDGFNSEVEKRNQNKQFDDNGELYKKLPLIVIIIDDLADLIEKRETQESIKLLTQTGFVVGMHLVFATQRPPDKTIKRFVKEHFRARLSLRVSSKADSQAILDAEGAEFLLGRGDLLFLPPASLEPIRVHGAFVDEQEINQIVEHAKAQGNPEYDTTTTKTDDEPNDSANLTGRNDVLFVDALRTVAQSKRASTSLLQRHLQIGYGRAAAILDAMVHEGYIGDMDGSSRARPVLQKAFDDLKLAETGEL